MFISSEPFIEKLDYSVSPHLKQFLDRMEALRRKLNQIDPRDIFLLEKLKLMKESSLALDCFEPDKSYCEKWFTERRND